MRVALCLSGQARGIDICWNSFMKYIIRPTNCDIFMSFANDSSVDRLFKIKDLKYTGLELIEDPSLEYLYSIARGDTSYIEHIGTYTQECCNLAVLRQFYSMNRANNLKIEYEKMNGFVYNWVIRSRADIIIEENIGDLNIFETEFIYTPNTNTHGGLNDFFAYGSSANMDIYSNRIREIKKYGAKHYPFWNPHQELANILHNNNIQVAVIPVSIKRERDWRGEDSLKRYDYYGEHGKRTAKRVLAKKNKQEWKHL